MIPSSLKPMHSPIVGIAGWKKSGKTTLTTKLVAEFVRRGLRVATIKHAHHNFQIDDDATDSARHRKAGAAQVAVVSARRWALISELGDHDEPDFADVVAQLQPCDLIIVEGYKTHPIPKIEARRMTSVTRTPLSVDDPNIFAIAADHAVVDARGVPVFSLDDIGGMADLITRQVLGKR
jgi:molybdopterin-guanine dinucleotide biosynthesis adapter protein